jgi:hypothetical protein
MARTGAGILMRCAGLRKTSSKPPPCPEKERVGLDEEPPFDFWEYFELIPPEEFSEHDFSEGRVSYAGRSTGTSWWNAR